MVKQPTPKGFEHTVLCFREINGEITVLSAAISSVLNVFITISIRKIVRIWRSTINKNNKKLMKINSKNLILKEIIFVLKEFIH